MKKTVSFFICLTLCLFLPFISSAAEMELDAKSVILIEASSGKVLYEKNADEKLPPASVTKIMTMLLVMEAVSDGKIALTDTVTVSEKAAHMGGSQVYLEVGETMSVDEMMKCVAVASANDAALALAEHTYGSEEAFVERMNERAKELGMTNTNFENTNGLDDTTTEHYTSARDIAIMSKELLSHEKIFDYTTIWMDSVRGGAFTLTNTNRLIRFYKGANGLKTGSTSKAKFCISASAEREGMQLIAVVMASSTRDARNTAAAKLLDYGFANYSYVEYPENDMGKTPVVGGVLEDVKIISGSFEGVVKKGDVKNIVPKAELPEKISAPVKNGDIIGKINYMLGDEIVGTADVIAAEDVPRVDFWFQFKKNFNNFLLY